MAMIRNCLLLSNNLAIWHLYLTSAIAGLIGYIQGLAFSASQALIVPKQHYVRIGALGSIQGFGSGVFAPALAGILYPLVGLAGILVLDVMTFIIAVGTLVVVHIPQPVYQDEMQQEIQVRSRQQLTFGFRYLLQHPSLAVLQLFTLSFIFFDNAALLESVVLARTNNNTALGNIFGTEQGSGMALQFTLFSLDLLHES
ncbi:hypothetical protein CSQ79_02195 [Gloeocapsopsis sp. IPPAS B-1203]|nr:hypothetical protein CSQ79_02195 [Gloeocapsopsis sp. IPPAS B-1203]